MTTFITIIFVIVALVMVLSILLQSGKGGGLGSALGGGASQGVFGGGGGADFMAKATQGFAAAFMITAMYLAYDSAHAGSDFLEGEDQGSEGAFEDDQEIDPERLGPSPLSLPTPEEGRQLQAAASVSVPAQSELDPAAVEAVEGAAAVEQADAVEGAEAVEGEAPAEQAGDLDPAMDAPAPTPASEEAGEPASRGDSPESDRGDSPQGGDSSLKNTPEKVDEDAEDSPAEVTG
ncbi:preprotein translocase subunit SecG [Pseudenhygromyxa sp. WMMC2535]|uniref:preprotein translocase subunit SecG n=1 Tax=Pseudenhygromyxa sp. WMMC2535 TaxID=2712867 RepID=UPI0015573619|nr:preprotein translocase subunit SecG [Pseudenhygromyxa sp. WMMC2535]NVB41852.1 preprotein translocase subunit SecG [Pseudenhygromyxa sp. WMMC2535]